MPKITTSMASMHPSNHAFTPYHCHLPLFPIFPLYPLDAGGRGKRNDMQ